MPISKTSVLGRLTASALMLAAGCAIHAYGLAQEMTSLGVLPGDQQSRAEAISADGSVIVGISTIGFLNTSAFTYSNGVMSPLGTLGGADSWAFGISADGLVIVGGSSTSIGHFNAFKYVGGAMTNLGTIGGVNSTAYGVSGNGSVVVGWSENSNGDYRAFKHTNGVMSDLGTLGGNESYAWAVSGDGSVIVGDSQIASGQFRAFEYVNGVMTNLGTLGGDNSYAFGVSDDGSVIVGGAEIDSNQVRAFKYVNGVMSNLGTLGGETSVAYGVSANGSVIVGDSQIASGQFRAFKYVNGVMTNLGTLGGNDSAALAVSAVGDVIVGFSTTENGEERAFVYRWRMIDVLNTYETLATDSNQLNTVMNLQSTLLVQGLSHDCTTFGKNNVCMAVGATQTGVDSPSASELALNLRLAYRFNEHFRLGAFIDQGLNNSMPSNYRLSNPTPLFGLFAGWAQHPNGLGLQLRGSVAYSDQSATITRSSLPYTEPGAGSTSFVSQGAQIEAAWGEAVGTNWVVQPFIGLRYDQVRRGAYSESGVDFPVSYNAVTQSSTTGFLGARVAGQVTDHFMVRASAGMEQDFSSSMNNFSGTINTLGAFSFQTPSLQQTRAFASVGFDYLLNKNHRINATLAYRQQTLNSGNGYWLRLSYEIGF
ncbi:MAG: autotransporter domain-containing protein [Burkholderiaceae bacterium]|nr:autotransporter domain-containing protein [Burkholderiaceae bacterium]